MNKLRAQEIAADPNMKYVTYNGMPIYIQHVSEDGNSARIFPVDAPEHEQVVSLNDLVEG
jgi:small acid-soluble spore protein H (minor)